MGENKQTNNSGLPSIENLFSESWALLKKSFKQMLILGLLSIGCFFLLLLLFGVLFLVMGFLGIGVASAHISALALLAGLIMIVAVILFIVFMIIISSVSQIGTLVILNEPDTYSIGQIVKKSLHYILPLIGVGLLSFVLVFPLFILFIVPGMIVSFLFAFATYELVLNNRGILGAIKRSIYVVKSHFWSILARALILAGISILVSIASSISNIWLKGFGSLLFFPVTIFLGFYGTAYRMVLYKHAEAATVDKEKESSLRWLLIVWLISLIFVGLIIVGIASVVTSPSFQYALQNFAKQNSTKTSTHLAPVMPITQEEADVLAEGVFIKVNDYRVSKDLPVFAEDQKLCAFAQKRLLDLATLGRYDDEKGFYEDVANPNTVRAYFTGYDSVNEIAYLSLDASITPESVVTAWEPAKEGKRTILINPTAHDGCVRADTKNMYLIIAAPK
jgi:hypothetical protein